MKVGLLGYAQSGRHTMFALLIGRPVAQHREGETLEGIAPVHDPRVDAIAKIAKPQKIKYAELDLLLCPDIQIESGKREWLETARRCDLLCVVIRAFSSSDVYHPAGSVDPARDRSNIEAELMFADLELVEKRLERLAKEKRGGLNPAQAVEEKALGHALAALNSNKPLRLAEFAPHELASIKSLGLVTLLPVLWAYNVDETELQEGDKARHSPEEFRVSCKIEQEINAIDNQDERQEYLRGLGLDRPGIDRMNQAAYDTVGLMSFYTMGPDEVRAWTIRKQSLAPTAGGKIHSDIERGFIRVEVIKYEDLLRLGSEEEVKKQGRTMVKGRDYVIEDGDICNFRFNV